MRLTQSPTAVLTVWLLCGMGFYASARMLRKLARADRGELTEASVVQSPSARLFGRTPNAWLGLVYYPAAAVLFVLQENGSMRFLFVVVSACAAATSCVLAYDLLYRTRRSCALCWTAHAVNAALFLSAIAVENSY